MVGQERPVPVHWIWVGGSERPDYTSRTAEHVHVAAKSRIRLSDFTFTFTLSYLG